MDDVFKALSDPTRRTLLDLLKDRDGQTVTELEGQLDMTRFGVMKHLKILEEASLITTKKSGRFKHHYLNTAPIQQITDRWIAPYVQPWTRMAIDLKTHLERETAMTETKTFVLETYIRTTPERLWKALTSAEDTRAYYFGSAVESEWKVGSPVRYTWPDGKMMLDGDIVEIDPPKKLVTTFRPHFMDAEHPETKVTYEIVPMGKVCKLTLTHEAEDGVPGDFQTGWTKICNGLKTLLETGTPLELSAS